MPASSSSTALLLLRGLALVATAVVVWGSLGNVPQFPGGFLDFEGADKVKHFAAYFTLACLYWLAFRQNLPAWGKWMLFGGLFTLGAILELLQWSFYPERFFEFADMLANGLGAGLGVVLISRTFPQP